MPLDGRIVKYMRAETNGVRRLARRVLWLDLILLVIAVILLDISICLEQLVAHVVK